MSCREAVALSVLAFIRLEKAAKELGVAGIGERAQVALDARHSGHCHRFAMKERWASVRRRPLGRSLEYQRSSVFAADGDDRVHVQLTRHAIREYETSIDRAASLHATHVEQVGLRRLAPDRTLECGD